MYNDFILAHLGESLREVFLEMINIKNYEWQSDWAKQHIAQGHAEGKAEGKAEGNTEGQLQAARLLLTRQLTLKFGAPSEAHTRWIAQADFDALALCLDRILTAERAEEVLGLSAT